MVKEFILWFKDVSIDDVPLVGGKNASLGEMYRELTKKGVNIPNGFALTAYAYDYFMVKSELNAKINRLLRKIRKGNIRSLNRYGSEIRDIILDAEFPSELSRAIKNAYDKLCKEYKKTNLDVAVRSSATAEDLPDASFAGQQETYLNIRGYKQLIEACKKCIASLFTDRAIHYRLDKGFSHQKVKLSVGIQKMVRSDKASSGVMFTIDTESGFKDVVYITASYGLGENIVQGKIIPDEYYVFKKTLNAGYKPIINKQVGSKALKLIYDISGNKTTKNVVVDKEDRKRFVLNDEDILKLAEWGMIIEEHYSKKADIYKPMDIEWAMDGNDKKLYIVQARPETVQSQKDRTKFYEYKLKKKGKVLVEGDSVGSKIGSGAVNIIKDVHEISNFKKGQVLVTEMTDPDWEPIMKIASGIITNKGGRTCFSGDTKILTNNGFFTMEEIYNLPNYMELKVPSLNRNTLKMEWKSILAVMKKSSPTIKVTVSQTGSAKNNLLDLTPNHKMINIRNSEIVDTEIQEMLSNKESVTVCQFIPVLNSSTEKDKKLAYLLGAISSDGHIYTSRTHGEVAFIQKPTEEKQEFISTVKDIIKELYNKNVGTQTKSVSKGIIRGKEISGTAESYRLYSKQIAYELKHEQKLLAQTLLSVDEEVIYNFLAGVIDGDGTFSSKNNRISIYISKEYLAQSVIVGCLRLGIFPQVTNNRNIYNIQIVEKLDEIAKYTKRVKCKSNRKVQATRFFSAKQLFDDKNYGTNINTRRNKGLLISEKDILSEKRFDVSLNNKLSKLIASDIRQLRVVKSKTLGEKDVYNITVADNHNYVVFTEQYTPVVVNNCHAAIVSRELGIPCIVGTLEGTKELKNKQIVTVDCSQGETGFVYQGKLAFELKEYRLNDFRKTRTKIMLNLGNPQEAFNLSFIPNEGVGLAREEFIINSYIKIHPLALIDYDKLKDSELKKQIEELTYNYKDKSQFFVDKLAEGIAMIAAAFYPKDVIIRFSDFKSNEYANLIGGKLYEPEEGNPMIGWRGASRYYDEKFKKAFALECKAVKKAREEFGLTNIKVMVPFCRTIEEGKKVIKEMEFAGLKQGKDLEVYVMCEIPSNVILADDFAKIFDGFSIGTNDLTQLTLGLDRDSELVSDIYDERNEAVKRLVSEVISVAKSNDKKIGICGDAPSTFDDFAQFLVEEGIDSISLSPDAVMKTTLKIIEKEEELGILPKLK